MAKTNNLKFEFELMDELDGYKLVNCDLTTSEIVIPDVYNGKPVVSIGESVFYDDNLSFDDDFELDDSTNEQNKINKIIIPKSVKVIEGSFSNVHELIVHNANIDFLTPVGDVKKIIFLQPFEENLIFLKKLLYILSYSNSKTIVSFIDETLDNNTISYTYADIKKINKRLKENKKELEIKKNEEASNFSYDYIIQHISNNQYRVFDKKKTININVFTSFHDFDFGHIRVLYALKKDKNGTFTSGSVTSYKENSFLDFCGAGNNYEEWPGYIDFKTLDEMQNYLNKCIKRTTKKTILIRMSTDLFECIEITKLKFKEIEAIVNGTSSWQGFYVANSIIYAISVHSE